MAVWDIQNEVLFWLHLLKEIICMCVPTKWVSVSEPHTRAFNVEFCLYSTYVRWSVHRGRLNWLSVSLVLHATIATTCTYCPAPFYMQFQEWDHTFIVYQVSQTLDFLTLTSPQTERVIKSKYTFPHLKSWISAHLSSSGHESVHMSSSQVMNQYTSYTSLCFHSENLLRIFI